MQSLADIDETDEDKVGDVLERLKQRSRRGSRKEFSTFRPFGELSQEVGVGIIPEGNRKKPHALVGDGLAGSEGRIVGGRTITYISSVDSVGLTIG